MIAGLKVLMTKFPQAKSIIICNELDSFAITIATDAEKHYNYHSKFKSEEEVLDKELIFLQLVSGVNRLSSQRLISLECITEWVNIMLGHPLEYGIFTNIFHLLWNNFHCQLKNWQFNAKNLRYQIFAMPFVNGILNRMNSLQVGDCIADEELLQQDPNINILDKFRRMNHK